MKPDRIERELAGKRLCPQPAPHKLNEGKKDSNISEWVYQSFGVTEMATQFFEKGGKKSQTKKLLYKSSLYSTEVWLKK